MESMQAVYHFIYTNFLSININWVDYASDCLLRCFCTFLIMLDAFVRLSLREEKIIGTHLYFGNCRYFSSDTELAEIWYFLSIIDHLFVPIKKKFENKLATTLNDFELFPYMQSENELYPRLNRYLPKNHLRMDEDNTIIPHEYYMQI